MTEQAGRTRPERSGPEWHPAAVHVCRASSAPSATGRVYHVALGPRRPGQTPLSDLRDAGYEVLACGVVSGEVPECDVSSWPRCEHLLLRRE